MSISARLLGRILVGLSFVMAVNSHALGRSTLSLKDLKGILILSAKYSEKTDLRIHTADDQKFILQISSFEREQLMEILEKTELERSHLVAQLKESELKSKEELRKKRKDSQMRRISSTSSEDLALGKDIFNSIISETNIECGSKQKLSDFDSQHQITLEYEVGAPKQLVSTIKMGSQIVWSKEARKDFLVVNK